MILSLTSATPNTITINWTENVSSGQYYVYLNGSLIKKTFGFGCTLRGLAATTSYNIEVKKKSHFGVDITTTEVQSYSTTTSLIEAVSGDVYYFSLTGSDTTGDGSSGAPWRTLWHGCQQSYSEGAIFKMGPGTFVEPDYCIIPFEVSRIQGAGETQTIVKLDPSKHNQDTSNYQLDKFVMIVGRLGEHTNGCIIEHLTVDGESTTRHPNSPTKNGAWGGIFLYRTYNSIVRHCTITNTYFTGVWNWWGIGGAIHDCNITNCGWVDPGGNYLSGAVNVSKLSGNFKCYNNIITEDYGKGRGYRTIGAGDGSLTECHFFETVFNLDSFAAWQGYTAPNMCFEFWDEMYYGVFIYENECDNTISCVNKPSDPFNPAHSCRVLSNRIICEDDTGYPLEVSVSGYELAGNIIYAGANSGQIISDWEPTYYNLEFYDWSIHHNYIYGLTGGYPSTFFRNRNTLTNAVYANNTIEITSPMPHNLFFIDTAGETVAGTFNDNIIIRTTALNVQSDDYPKADAIFGQENYPGEPVGNYSITLNNNIIVNFPTAGSNVIAANPNFLQTGGIRNNPEAYYAIDNTSPAWGTAIGDSPNIGAFQPSEEVTGGNVPPVAFFTASPISGEAPLTVNVNASGSSDVDGTISYTWNWGDSTSNGTGVTASHTYALPGTYTILLTVVDDQGAQDTHSIIISVTEVGAPPPSKKISVSNTTMFLDNGRVIYR